MKPVLVSCQPFWNITPKPAQTPPSLLFAVQGKKCSPLWRISLISLLSRFQKHPGLSLHLICMEAILRTCFGSPLLFFSSLFSLISLSGSLVRLHRVLKSLVHLETSSNCSSLQCPPTIPFHIAEFGFFSPEYSFSFCVCRVHLFFPKNWDLNFRHFFNEDFTATIFSSIFSGCSCFIHVRNVHFLWSPCLPKDISFPYFMWNIQ